MSMALKGEDCFDNPYYIYIRRLLTVVGLWPSLKASRRWPCISFITILMIIAIIVQIYAMQKLERKVEPIATFLQTTIPTLAFTFAYWNLVYNSALVEEILEHVRNDWNKLICENELGIIQKYAIQSRVCSKVIACAFFLYGVVLVVPSIVRFFQYIFGIADTTRLTLPVYDETLVAIKYRYYIMFPGELLAIWTGYVIGVTHYAMFISFLQHACALFVLVSNKIDQQFTITECKFYRKSTLTKREVEFKWIVSVIKNYNNAIKFAELITLLYGKIYIVEISALLGLIIIDYIYLFQLLSLKITAGEALKVGLYINGSVLMGYAYNYLGERLMQHSTSVYVKCQLVPFYTLSVETNKMLLLLIMRSMKPCNFSVGGILVASHKLFAKIIKVSFSFATVCYNVH